MVHRQNVPRDKTSQGHKVPRQKVPGTKRPKGQNVPGTKRPKYKISQGTKCPIIINKLKKQKIVCVRKYFKIDHICKVMG